MRLDPRVKLIAILLFSTLAVLATDVVYLSIAVFLVIIFNALLKNNPLPSLKKLRGLISLILFISILQSIFIKGGKPLIYIKSFTLLSTKGLLFGAEFLLRMTIIIFSGLIAMSSSPREMVDGMIKLHIPYELAFMTTLSINYLPALKNEFTTRLNAITLRGIELKKLSLPKKIKLFSYLLSPVLSGCVLKSKDLSLALLSKAFGAGRKRTMLRELKLTFTDWLVIIVLNLASGVYLYFMYTLGGII